MESQPQGLLGRANQCICGCFGHKVNTPNMAVVTTTEIISGPGSQTQSASRTQALGSAISGPGRQDPSLLPSADQRPLHVASSPAHMFSKLPSYKATCPCHGPYTVLGQNRQRWPCTEPSLKAHMYTHACMHTDSRYCTHARSRAPIHGHTRTHTHTSPPSSVPTTSHSPLRISTKAPNAQPNCQYLHYLCPPNSPVKEHIGVTTVTPLLISPSNQRRKVLLFPF